MSIGQKVRLALIVLGIAGTIASVLQGVNLNPFDVIGGGDLSPD